MGLSKRANFWKNVILPLIGTGGIGAVLIALLNHGGGHNIVTGNISGNVVIGDHSAIQINTNTSIIQLTTNFSSPTQPQATSNSSSLTPNQIIAEIRSAR